MFRVSCGPAEHFQRFGVSDMYEVSRVRGRDKEELCFIIISLCRVLLADQRSRVPASCYVRCHCSSSCPTEAEEHASSVLLLTPLAGCGACTFRMPPAFWPTCLRAEAYDGETHGLRCSPGRGVRLAYAAPVRSTCTSGCIKHGRPTTEFKLNK